MIRFHEEGGQSGEMKAEYTHNMEKILDEIAFEKQQFHCKLLSFT